MLKYLILSTPRCGSSTLMKCCDIWFGEGTFVREPLNPYEDRKFHPAILHGLSVGARGSILCDPASPIVGVKHVHSPFNREMSGETNWEILGRVLSVKGLRVILLSRQNVRHQFVSMEVALQTGDWWSDGPGALPSFLKPIRAGRDKPIGDDIINTHLDKLNEANITLRRLCLSLGTDFIERTYEELFPESSALALNNTVSSISHFGIGNASGKTAERILQTLDQGQRFRQMEVIRKNLEKTYPSLRDC